MEQRSLAGRRWKTFAIALLASFVPMGLWSLASPLGSVPDEPAHFVRAAAVVDGQVRGDPLEDDPGLMAATVPAYVAYSATYPCMAFDPAVTAACIVPLQGDPDAPTVAGTSAGVNSPLYYAIVGTPTLFMSGDAALYAMRVVNALLCAVLLGLMFSQLAQLTSSRWTMLSTAAVITPMMLYLGGSVNPNMVEVASTGALFASLLSLFRLPSPGRMLVERLVIVVGSAALLMNTRSIALLWVLVVVASTLLLSRAERLRELVKRPLVWVSLGVCAILGILAVWWYLRPFGVENAGEPAPPVSTILTFFNMLVRTFDYGEGWIGLFGWMDTPSPGLSLTVWAAILVAILAAALTLGRARGRVVVIGLGAVALMVPPIVQASVIGQYGYIWQGRYVLAIILCVFVACGIVLDEYRPSVPSPEWGRVVRMGLVLLVAGHVFAFVSTLKRYTVGSKGTYSDMLGNAQWQPPGSWLLLAVLYTIAIAWGAWMVWRAFRRGADDDARIATPART